MERKEELWRKLHVQIPHSRQSVKIKRASTNANQLENQFNKHCEYDQESEAFSPTFRRQWSLKSDADEGNFLSYSFGQNFFVEITQVFKEQCIQKRLQQQQFLCIQCDSVQVHQNVNIADQSFPSPINDKFFSLICNTKKQIHQLKHFLQAFKQNFTQLSVLYASSLKENCLKLQQKYQQMLIKQRQKLIETCETLNNLQQKYQCLQSNNIEVMQKLQLQKLNNQNLKIQIAQLTGQIQSKTQNNIALLQQNSNLNFNLLKIVKLLKQANLDYQLIQQSKQQTIKTDKIGLHKTKSNNTQKPNKHPFLSKQKVFSCIQNYFPSPLDTKQSIVSSVTYTPTTYTSTPEQNNSPTINIQRKLSRQNSNVLIESIRNHLNKKEEKIQQNNCKIGYKYRKNSDNCKYNVTQFQKQTYFHRASLNNNNKYQKFKNGLCNQKQLAQILHKQQNTNNTNSTRLRRNSTTSAYLIQQQLRDKYNHTQKDNNINNNNNISLMSNNKYNQEILSRTQSNKNWMNSIDNSKSMEERDKILDKIRRLKEDIKTDIIDMKRNTC